VVVADGSRDPASGVESATGEPASADAVHALPRTLGLVVGNDRTRRPPVHHDRPETALNSRTTTTHDAPHRYPGRLLIQELRRWPTLVLLAICLVVGIPVVIALNPPVDVVSFGQHIGVGARAPDLSLSGPAQLVQVGNTRLDVPRLQVDGPLRPQLTIGPVQRNAAAAQLFDRASLGSAATEAVAALEAGFVHWYLRGALGLVAFAVVAAAAGGCLRILVALRQHGRSEETVPHIGEIARRWSGTIRRTTVLAVVVSLLGWAAAGVLAYAGAASGLQDVRSLSDLVGASHVTPAPVGPVLTGYTGAVIGDSRAVRVGGPPVADPTGDDTTCERSADSPAVEIGRVTGEKVLNLACPGATIASGLRGAQQRDGTSVPPQIGRLKQVQNLRFVVVVIGPNDLGWTDFIQYCYAVADCADNLTQGEFDYRLAAFDRDYGDLLQDLDALDGHPQIVVMTSYDVLDPDADPACPAVRGPAGTAGLNPTKIELLANRNAALNHVLAAGAEKYGFSVASPALTPLCTTGADQIGADLQGLTDPEPFHPTALGSLRMAASVAALVEQAVPIRDRGSG